MGMNLPIAQFKDILSYTLSTVPIAQNVHLNFNVVAALKCEKVIIELHHQTSLPK